MWKCKGCGLEIMFTAVAPDIDGDGIYFLCPGCERRNALINVGDEDGPVALAQPNE